jgi:hypothetical protein
MVIVQRLLAHKYLMVWVQSVAVHTRQVNG